MRADFGPKLITHFSVQADHLFRTKLITRIGGS